MKKTTLLTAILLVIYSALYAQYFGNVSVIVWDNDNNTRFMSDDGILCDYEDNIINSLLQIGLCNNDIKLFEQSPDWNDMKDLSAVFIIMGNREESMFTDSDIHNLGKYLDKGGCLYIEGNNVVEYLESNYPDFIHYYFNVTLHSSSQDYANCDTLEAVVSEFANGRIFAYPKNSEADLGTDALMQYRNIDEYYDVLRFDSDEKMYKSTAAAYSMPQKSTMVFRTFIQTVAMSAMYSPSGISEESDILRMEYMKDILRFYGISRTLYIVEEETEGQLDNIEYISPESFSIKGKDIVQYNLIILSSELYNEFEPQLQHFIRHNGRVMIIEDGSKAALYNEIYNYCDPVIDDEIMENGNYIFIKSGNISVTSVNPNNCNSLVDKILTKAGGFYNFEPIRSQKSTGMTVTFDREGDMLDVTIVNANDWNVDAYIYRDDEILSNIYIMPRDKETLELGTLTGNYSVCIDGIAIASYILVNRDTNGLEMKIRDRNIYSDNEEQFILQVYDLTGREMIYRQSPSKTSTANLSSGIYFIRMHNEHQSLTEKLVIY